MVSKVCVVGAYQRKLEELAALGVELTVAVPPYWRDDAGRKLPLERRHTSGYELVVTPMALNGHFHLHLYPWLDRLMRRAKPDLLHMDEEPYNLATSHALWLAARDGVTSLFFSWQNLLRRYPPPFGWLERLAYGLAAGAIVGNREAGDVLRAKGFARPLWVIPQFGVDPDLFRPLRRERPPGGLFTIGFAGRLNPKTPKGADTLIEALAMVGDHLRLELLAWGPDEQRLRALAEAHGVGDRVRFRPGLPSSQMPAFYNDLDVFVLPSRTSPQWKEQFGRVLVEAMACGVPVVGSDSGEIPHVVGDAGLIFPEGNAAALADHLRALRDSPVQRRDLAARGRERVLALYTQRRIAEQTLEAYQALRRGS